MAIRSKRKTKSLKRNNSEKESGDDDEQGGDKQEDDDELTRVTRSKTRAIPRNPSDEETDEEVTRSSKKKSMKGAMKELRIRREERRGPRRIQRVEESSDSEKSSEENASETESEATDFLKKTKSFKSKYSNLCEHPSCGKRFIAGKTHTIGVFFKNPRTGRPEGKPGGKPYWICASHSMFAGEEQDPIGQANNGSATGDSEPDTEDEDFIDDGDKNCNVDSPSNKSNSDQGSCDEQDGYENELKTIKKHLERNTPSDKANKKNYLDEHSKYQLEIHTPTNPGLHLSPEKRLKRNLRTASFDKGLKEARGIEHGDPEYGASRELIHEGRTVKVFPSSRQEARYAQNCALEGCPRRWGKGDMIVGAMLSRGGRPRLNDLGKRDFICADHESSATHESDSDTEDDN
jgi:hypothetical protein